MVTSALWCDRVRQNYLFSYCTLIKIPRSNHISPLKFISYTEDVTLIFDRHDARHQLFADDKQAYADAPLSTTHTYTSLMCSLSPAVNNSLVSPYCAVQKSRQSMQVTRCVCVNTCVLVNGFFCYVSYSIYKNE